MHLTISINNNGLSLQSDCFPLFYRFAVSQYCKMLMQFILYSFPFGYAHFVERLFCVCNVMDICALYSLYRFATYAFTCVHFLPIKPSVLKSTAFAEQGNTALFTADILESVMVKHVSAVCNIFGIFCLLFSAVQNIIYSTQAIHSDIWSQICRLQSIDVRRSIYF